MILPANLSSLILLIKVLASSWLLRLNTHLRLMTVPEPRCEKSEKCSFEVSQDVPIQKMVFTRWACVRALLSPALYWQRLRGVFLF